MEFWGKIGDLGGIFGKKWNFGEENLGFGDENRGFGEENLTFWGKIGILGREFVIWREKLGFWGGKNADFGRFGDSNILIFNPNFVFFFSDFRAVSLPNFRIPL